MTKLIISLVVFILLAGVPLANAGSYTANSYFWKPAYRESGPAAYSSYNAALDATDLFLNSLEALPGLINNWAIEDQIVTMIPVTSTYSDADTFTLPGDYTSRFTAGAVVQVHVAAGMVYSTVASSSYVAPTTTVNLSNAVLTNPITRVYVVATRDGLWPNGPGYVVARDYGTDRAALVAADAVAAGANKELRITYAYTIDIDVTLSAPKITIQPGVPFAISTTKTLTFTNPPNIGLYRAFTCAGTGKVVMPANAQKMPDWWGAVGDDATDDSVPLQAWATCGGNLYLPKKTYKITAAIIVPQYAVVDGLGTIHQVTNTLDGLAVKDDVTIKNITMKASGSATKDPAYYHHLGICSYSVYDNSSDGAALEASYVGKRVTIDNVSFTNGWVRAVILTADGIVKNSTFTDCVSEAILFHGIRNKALFNTITNTGGWAIDFNGGDSEASFNIIRVCASNSLFAGDAGGISFAGLAAWKPMTNLRVIGNTIDDHKYGYGILVVSFMTNGVWGDITISNNYINGADTTNTKPSIYLYIGGSTVTCKNAKITNNIVTNTIQGLMGVYLEGAIISGNIFKTIHPDNVDYFGAVQLAAINRVVFDSNVITDVNGATQTALHLASTINNCRIVNNIGEGGTVGIFNATGMTGTGNDISGNDFSGCTTPIFLQEALAAGNLCERNNGYPVTPAIPASTVQVRNDYAFPMKVTITGGTVTVIAKGPTTGALVTTGAITGAFILQPKEYIAITYSAAPTWIWLGI